MSDTLIEQLNKITHGNLCDPMMVNTDDWNSMLASVTKVLGQLEQSQARVADLESKAEKGGEQ